MKLPRMTLVSAVMALVIASGASAQVTTYDAAAPTTAPGDVSTTPSAAPATPVEPMAPATRPTRITSDPVAETAAVAGAMELPQPRIYGDVRYVTGGVTYESQPAFKDARVDFPLNIELYQKNGTRNEFTADAEVKVINRAGATVLEAKADGPYLFAKVPPGTYRIEASLNGKTAKSTATVGKGSTRAMLVFPQGTD